MVLVGLLLEAVWEQEDEVSPAPCPQDLHAPLPLEKHFHFSLVNFHLLNQRYHGGWSCFHGTVFFQDQISSDFQRGRCAAGRAPRSHDLLGEVPVFLDGHLCSPRRGARPGCPRLRMQKGRQPLVRTISVVGFQD